MENNINQDNTNRQTKTLTMENSQSVSDAFIAEQAAALTKTDDMLSVGIKQRLVEARQLAVNRLLVLQSQHQVKSSGNVLLWLGDHVLTPFMQHRAMSMVFAMVIITFFAVQQFGVNDNIENSDAYLLASDLPPEAFADKGFNTWIVSARN